MFKEIFTLNKEIQESANNAMNKINAINHNLDNDETYFKDATNAYKKHEKQQLEKKTKILVEKQ